MPESDYKKLTKAQLIAALEDLQQHVDQLENRDATQELALSEARYRALVEDSSDFIYILDKDGRFTFANQEAERLLGYPPEDIIGKHFSEVMHPKDVEALGRAFHERRTGDRATRRLEVRLSSRAGDTRDVEMDIRHFTLSASGLYREGDFLGTHGVARDITERKYYENRSRTLQQVRETVWNMISSDDIQQLLEAVKRALEAMRIPFHHCGVNVLDMSEPPMMYSYTSYGSSAIAKRREWMVSDAEHFASTIAEIWQQGRPVFRRDLEEEDLYQERESITELYGPVRALIDAPFSHGTLTVTNTAPDAFSQQHLSFIQELAGTLSEGFRRMEDLEQLALSEQRYRTLVETPNFVVMLLDTEGNYLYVSPQIEDWLGYAPQEFYEDPGLGQRIVHPDDLSDVGEMLNRSRLGAARRDVEYRWEKKSGEYRWASASIFPIYEDPEDELINKVSMMQVVVQDITERKQGEEQLKASLAEKEVLLKEIHHRVKNNLQIISSLLHLQARNVEDRQVLAVFDDSQNRIRSMALVHEELYKSDDLTRIDFSRYLHQLIDNLLESYGADSGRISLQIQVDDILLNIDTAIPLGLIINELTSNALKHAFPGDRKGVVQIELKSSGDERFVLRVSDDGVGFPEDLDLQTPQTLGLKLVDTLSSQLRSRIELDQSHGTRFTIVRE